jgi:hypothetical protein
LRDLYKYVQALSLDVALGATIMSAFVAHFMQVAVPFGVYFSLFVAVWLIYTIDHLIDASKLKSEKASFRHLFHQKHFNTLTVLWVFVFLFGVFYSFLLPYETRKIGFIASALVIVHLVLVYLLGSRVSVFIQKELGIAFTYCVGIAVGPVSLNPDFNNFGYFFLGQIFLLALINLLEFSWFDKTIDKKQGQTSAILNLGEKLVIELIFFLLSLFMLSLVLAFLFFPKYEMYEITLAVMSLVLFVIIAFQKYFAKKERYRVLGDMIFLFPSIMLVLF